MGSRKKDMGSSDSTTKITKETAHSPLQDEKQGN
jgi:hypothetical protein